jgi:hypothetical protein
MERVRVIGAALALGVLVAPIAAAQPGRQSPTGSSPSAPVSAVATPTAASPGSSFPSGSTSASPSPASPVAFHASVRPLDTATRRAMIAAGTWQPACPVALADLRLVSVSYWGFDGRPHVGRLVVNHDATPAIVAALRSLYAARFPIRRMELVDRYGADDERSMAADNTSAFNGRKVPGTAVWSQHAYGRAIDIDPLENPEIADGKVDPPQAALYVDRSQRVRGMIHAGDAVVRAFAAVGWTWGGSWHSLKDYQHFSANGY